MHPHQKNQKLRLKKEQVEKQNEATTTPEKTAAPVVVNDSLQDKQVKERLGSFTYSSSLPSAKDEFTVIENELLSLKIANKGGYIVNATVKGIEQFERDSKSEVQIIKDNNASLYLTLNTKDNRVLNTKEM